jgi:hypothetical protein
MTCMVYIVYGRSVLHYRRPCGRSEHLSKIVWYLTVVGYRPLPSALEEP